MVVLLAGKVDAIFCSFSFTELSKAFHFCGFGRIIIFAALQNRYMNGFVEEEPIFETVDQQRSMPSSCSYENNKLLK